MYHGNRASNNNIKSWGCDMSYQLTDLLKIDKDNPRKDKQYGTK